MIRFAFYILLLILSSFSAFTKNKVYITFNPGDCTACTISLKYLDSLENNIDRFFVFEESYRSDSAQLVEQFYLKKYGCEYLFSDSLFKKINGKTGFSTLALFMDDDVHHTVLPLKEFTVAHAKRFNLLSKEQFSFPLEHSRNAILASQGYTLWLRSGLDSKITAYDIFSQKSVAQIDINDSVLNKSYNLFFNKADIYAYHKKMLRQLEVPKPTEIRSFTTLNDTIYIVSQNSYLDSTEMNNDVLINGFYSLEMFTKKGELITTNPIVRSSYLNNYFAAPYLHKQNNQLYVTLHAENDTVANRNFMSTLKLDAKNTYAFDKVLPYTLPDDIYKSNSCLDVLFYKEYFVLPLEGIVRKLSDGSAVVDMKLFEGIINVSSNIYSPPPRYVHQFRYEGNTVWLIYGNNESNTYSFVKYNVVEQKIVMEKKLFGRNEYTKPFFCDFNFNYITYSKQNHLQFQKMQ